MWTDMAGESFVHFVSRSCIPEYLAVYPRPLPEAMYPSLKSLLMELLLPGLIH